MRRVYTDEDASLEPLAGRTVAVLGYGSQGHAHALNLRDSGIDVVVGLREGSPRRADARADGMAVAAPAEAVARADVVALLVPDDVAAEVFEGEVRAAIVPGATIVVADGYAVHHGELVVPSAVDIVMVAPKAPGALLRRAYVEGVGVPALLAVGEEASPEALGLGLAYAQAIGTTRAGAIATTFAEQTVADLFGEQAVLYGGLGALVTAAFETLVAEGCAPEVAYLECVHELKLVVDLLYEGGLPHVHASVFDVVAYGGATRGPRIVDGQTRERMAEVLAEIRDGRFAAEWADERERGRPTFGTAADALATHPMEAAGARLRALMGWLP